MIQLELGKGCEKLLHIRLKELSALEPQFRQWCRLWTLLRRRDTVTDTPGLQQTLCTPQPCFYKLSDGCSWQGWCGGNPPKDSPHEKHRDL